MFLEETRYSLKELQDILTEKTNKNEFKPKFGNKVESENQKNNEKAAKDIIKQTGVVTATVGGLVKNGNEVDIKNNLVNNPNKETVNIIKFANKPSDRYLENNIEANVKGYPSKANMDSHKNDEDEKVTKAHETNNKVYDAEKEKTKDLKNKMDIRDKSGLAARTHERTHEFGTAFDNKGDKKSKNESKVMKRLHFKNTRFLSEAQMLEKVPEEYKVDGNRFYMRDNTGTDYLVECEVDNDFNYTSMKVINKINKNVVNEQLSRMKSLSSYNSSDYFNKTSAISREEETGRLSEMLERVKDFENK